MEEPQEAGPPQGLGARLRKLRVARGMTQAVLASPRFSHAYVSTIESGRRNPSMKAVQHFADKLGVDPDELLTGQSKARIKTLEIDLQRARGEISGGEVPQARFRLKRILKESKQFQIHRVEARAEEVLALADEQEGKAESALKRFERALSIYRSEAPSARAYAIAGKVRTLQALGDSHHAVYVGEAYLDELGRRGMASPSAIVRVLSPMVVAYLSAGSQRLANEAAEECLRLTPRVNDPGILAAAHVNVAAAEVSAGHYTDAAKSLEKAEQLYETLELHHEAGIVHLNRGHTETRLGNLQTARLHLNRAIELLGAAENRIQQANAALELARVDRLEGNLEDSVARLRDALEQLPADGQSRLRAWGQRELALSLTDLDPKESEKHFGVAVDLYEQIEEPLELARTHSFIAALRTKEGDVAGALEAYRASSQALESWPDF